jgi:hypothetical protein
VNTCLPNNFWCFIFQNDYGVKLLKEISPFIKQHKQHFSYLILETEGRDKYKQGLNIDNTSKRKVKA